MLESERLKVIGSERNKGETESKMELNKDIFYFLNIPHLKNAQVICIKMIEVADVQKLQLDKHSYGLAYIKSYSYKPFKIPLVRFRQNILDPFLARKSGLENKST